MAGSSTYSIASRRQWAVPMSSRAPSSSNSRTIEPRQAASASRLWGGSWSNSLSDCEEVILQSFQLSSHGQKFGPFLGGNADVSVLIIPVVPVHSCFENSDLLFDRDGRDLGLGGETVAAISFALPGCRVVVISALVIPGFRVRDVLSLICRP